MDIDKAQIIELMNPRCEQDKATQAQSDLPEQVATQQDSGLLAQPGINPTDLPDKLPRWPGRPHGLSF